MEVISGMDGVYQMLPKAAIPGAYNFTYQTLENGKAVPRKELLNYLTNENLYPVTFEIYPQIRSVTPQTGSLSGGTLLTIKGRVFEIAYFVIYKYDRIFKKTRYFIEILEEIFEIL